MCYCGRMSPTDDTAPLTKADGKYILEVMSRILARFDVFEGELQNIRVEMSASEQRIKADFRRGIQIVREEVAGANADKLAQYQDRLDDHDRRILVLERA